MAPKTTFASQARVVLPGSERKPVAAQPVSVAATVTAPVTPATAAKAATARPGRSPITVSVIVQSRQPVAAAASKSAGSSVRLTRAQFAREHGPDPASLKLIKAFASEFGLKVGSAGDAARCTLHLTGTQAALQKAFGVQLQPHQIGDCTYRVREGAIYLPEELQGHILAVLGLDNRPQAVAHFRVVQAHASNVSYTPVQVAQLYQFPANANAAGQTIGLIELGGGFRPADIRAYFKSLGLPAPTTTAVSVDKAKNSPSTASSADGEVMLDIEVAAAVAPGVKLAVYFAPNSDQGFVDAISTAIHDSVHKPSVISISWGGPESTWTAQAMTALDAACQAAATLGVTITVACGDNGSSDGVADAANHVDFPASSPHVLACGGTKLVGAGTSIQNETVWNEVAINEGATGGGVSNVFPLPAWQSKAGVPAPSGPSGGRGVPDVAGDADPATGYTIRVDGQTSVIGGTSAVAPLWAGLIALANAQNKTSAGFINSALYAASSAKAFRDITSGNNGSFSAGPGWDPCTGLGSPIGSALIAALAPKTPVNKPPVSTPPVKKTPVKKTPVKMSPVKKSPVKKSPVKKSPVKKSGPAKSPTSRKPG